MKKWLISSFAVVLFLAIFTGITLLAFRPASRPRSARNSAQTTSPNRIKSRVTMEEAMKAFLRDGNSERLKTQLLRAMDEDRSYAMPVFNLGILAEAEGNDKLAITWMEHVNRIEPPSDLSRRAEQALRRLRKRADMAGSPDGLRKLDFERAMTRARILLKSGRNIDAAQEAELASLIDPARHEAYCLRANALARQGAFVEADQQLILALNVAEGPTRKKVELARSEISTKMRYEKLFAEGDAGLGAKDYDKSAQSFHEAWNLSPEREEAGLRAALAFVLSNRPDRAKPILEVLVASKKPAVAREATAQLYNVNRILDQLEVQKKIEYVTIDQDSGDSQNNSNGSQNNSDGTEPDISNNVDQLLDSTLSATGE